MQTYTIINLYRRDQLENWQYKTLKWNAKEVNKNYSELQISVQYFAKIKIVGYIAI